MKQHYNSCIKLPILERKLNCVTKHVINSDLEVLGNVLMCFLGQNPGLAGKEEKIAKLIMYSVTLLKNQVTSCYLFKTFPKIKSAIKHHCAKPYTFHM